MIRLPPPIDMLHAVPYPTSDQPSNPADVVQTLPTFPGRPAPRRLPERPDEVVPPAGELRQSLSEYDRRMGLGGAGPIVSAAREVAQREWVTGQATIEIIADRSGTIQSARVVGVSRDEDGWRRYAAELRGSARGGMRLPETARGVWTLLAVRIGNERTSGHRYWWSPGAWLSFDLADVNARRVRTVHTQVLSEIWF
jgi:hypothetical protein